MAAERLLLFLSVICITIHMAAPAIDPSDSATLQSLMREWQNLPPSWTTSTDPCTKWDGVTCIESRVTALGLPSMSLKGTVSGTIGGLTELVSLDLSYNPGLTGTLSPAVGKLLKLNTLTLIGCSFTGNIPDEIGNLAGLTFLALNNNSASPYAFQVSNGGKTISTGVIVGIGVGCAVLLPLQILGKVYHNICAITPVIVQNIR